LTGSASRIATPDNGEVGRRAQNRKACRTPRPGSDA
jgi:hypothetical protein